MKERPIIMSGDNPKLILEGRKTQTRRIIKPQPIKDNSAWACYFKKANRQGKYGPSAWGLNESPDESMLLHCPYGVAGDRLWVREKHSVWKRENGERGVYYWSGASEGDLRNTGTNWKSSIHMPRWASRITLEIARVSVERVQDITISNVMSEGTYAKVVDGQVSKAIESLKPRFAARWDSLHGKGAWERNDWVWVIEFKLV